MFQHVQHIGFIPFLLIICFMLQVLKEAGIPTFGLMHSIMLFAGYRIALGNVVSGSGIFLTAMVGSLTGAFLVYRIAGLNGNKWARYLPALKPGRVEKAGRMISRFSFPAVFLGRLLPGIMLPVSLAAGMLHFPLLGFMGGVFLQLCLWVMCFLILGNTAGQVIPVSVIDTPALIDRFLPILLIFGGIAVISHLIFKKKPIRLIHAIHPH